jgi:hypothetical protein
VGDGPFAVADIELHILNDQLQQDKGEVGGITSPEAIAVVLHLADGQQHRKSVRWEMVPLL